VVDFILLIGIPHNAVLFCFRKLQPMQEFAEYNNSLLQSLPPDDLSVYLKALWYDAKGSWDKAHTIIQDVPGSAASWIHAYLHRKEGDIWNADYWYSKAGRKRPDVSLDEEWKSIVKALL
jgi:hypothetical protein